MPGADGAECFDLIFAGTADQSGPTREHVSRVLTSICGVDPVQIQPLFDQAPLVIRRGLSRDDLKVYQDALVSAGARVLVVKAERVGDAGVSEQHPALTPHARGVSLFSQGRYAEAAEVLASAVDSDTANIRYRCDYAAALREQGKFDEAARELIEAISIDPFVVEPLAELASLLFKVQRWVETVVICHKILALDPEHYQAYLLQGDALFKLSKFKRASEVYSRAVERWPGCAAPYAGLGLARFQAGARDEGLVALRMAVKLQPEAADVQLFLAEALLCVQRPSETISILTPLVERQPNNLPALGVLIKALLSNRDFVRARSLYAGAATLSDQGLSRFFNEEERSLLEGGGISDEHQAEIEHLLTSCSQLIALQRFDDAFQNCQRALALDSQNLGVRLRMIEVRLGLRAWSDAERDARELVQLYPHEWRARLALAETLSLQKRFGEARHELSRVLAQEPQRREVYIDLGRLYRAEGKLFEAIVSAKQALLIEPRDLDALTLLGTLYYFSDQFDRSIECFRKALEIKPDLPIALNGLGNVLFFAGREELDAGLPMYSRALNLENSPAVRFNRALPLLLKGDYINGFRDFEARLEVPGSGRQFTQPRWDGADPRGKTILVTLEQGYGDRIQFIRFVEQLRDRGARVIVPVDKDLLRLFRSIPGITLCGPDDHIPVFNCHVMAMSLPYHLGISLETLPRCARYLQAPPLRSERLLLPKSSRLRVGIALSGSRRLLISKYRQAPWERFARLLDLPGIDFVCLQRDFSAEEEAFFAERRHVWRPGRELADFGDTAAIVEQLDLVISIDTAVAHLAGALGKKCWILLGENSSWQWLLDRSDSPWYPSARLLRAESSRGWHGVCDQVVDAIAAEFSIKEDFPVTAEDCFSEARRCLDEGNIFRARVLADCAGQASAVGAEHAAIQGDIAHALGDCDTALARYAEAVALNPTSAAFYCAWGTLWREKGELGRARAAAERALEIDPKNAEALLLASRVLVQSGSSTEALARLEQLERECLDDPATILAKADLYVLLLRHQHARESYARVLELRPDCYDAALGLGRMYAACSMREQAIEQFEHARHCSPRRVEHSLAAAELLLAGNEPQRARLWVERAIQAGPENVEAQRLYARLMSRAGEHQSAIDSLYRALGATPGSLELLAELARAYKAAGEEDEVQLTVMQLSRLCGNDHPLVAELMSEFQTRLIGGPS